jgi:hypothetical protein
MNYLTVDRYTECRGVGPARAGSWDFVGFEVHRSALHGSGITGNVFIFEGRVGDPGWIVRVPGCPGTERRENKFKGGKMNSMVGVAMTWRVDR